MSPYSALIRSRHFGPGKQRSHDAWSLEAQVSSESLKSPTTGTQPGAPKANCPASGPPALFSFRRYQASVAGSTTPMPVWPEPVQSPTTGIQPGAPYLNCPASGPPALFSLRRYQVPVAGSTTPTVVVPLPSQSPTTGSHPGAP